MLEHPGPGRSADRRSARWDDIARVMIDFSDNSAADLLRATLGDAALVTAAAAGIHRLSATGGLGADVSPIVRRLLERVLAGKLPAGILGAGQKGGNLPGVISNAFTARRADGSVGVSVLMLSGMPWQGYQRALASGAPLLLSQQALLNKGVRERLHAAVG